MLDSGPKRHLQLLCIVLAGAVVGAPGRAAARPNVTAADLALLEKGVNLEYSDRVPGTKVMKGKAIGVIRDTPEALVHVLLELDKYKGFVPRVKESRITKRKGANTFAVLETSLPWPVKDCWFYIKATRYDKPGRVYEIKWWMLNGTMKNYNGEALIEPWNGSATESVLTYQILAEPKTAAPDSMISDGVRRIASIFVGKIRLRLLALRRFNKLPKGL